MAIEDATVDSDTIALSVWDRNLPAVAQVMVTTFVHECEGERWYRTVLGVVEGGSAC